MGHFRLVTIAALAVALMGGFAAPAAARPLLHEGSRGAAVRQWQSTLDRLAAEGKPGQPRIAVDGIFGARTRAATATFQQWAGIGVDGIVGPRTRTSARTALSSAALGSRSHLKPVLREGSRGPAVRGWQSTLDRLAARGKPRQPRIAVDGVYGPRTAAATMRFQRWAHLAVDGVVGVDTYTAAARALG